MAGNEQAIGMPVPDRVLDTSQVSRQILPPASGCCDTVRLSGGTLSCWDTQQGSDKWQN